VVPSPIHLDRLGRLPGGFACRVWGASVHSMHLRGCCGCAPGFRGPRGLASHV